MTNQHIVIGTLVGSSSTGMIHKVSRLGTAACATAVRYGSRGVNLRGVHELEEIVGTFCVRCFPIVEEVVVAEVAPVVEEFNYQTVIPSDAAIIRNSNIRPDDEERCLICSRPVNPTASATVTVHMTTDGTLFPVMDEGLWSDPRSQGAWYVGGECAKKIPAAFKSPTVVVDAVDAVIPPETLSTYGLFTARDTDTLAAIAGIANARLVDTNVSVILVILVGDSLALSVIVCVDGMTINNGVTVRPAANWDLSATADLIAETAETAAAVHASVTPAGEVRLDIASVEEIAPVAESRDWEIVTFDRNGEIEFRDATFAPTLEDASVWARRQFGPNAIARPLLTDDEKSVDPYPADGESACGVVREGTLGYQACILAAHSDAIAHMAQDGMRFGLANPCGCESTNHWDDEFGPRVDGIHPYLAVAAGSHIANFVGTICDLCAVVCIPTFVADAEANR